MTETTPNLGLILPDFNVSTWHDEMNGNFQTLDAALTAATGFGGLTGVWANNTAYVVGDRLVDNLTYQVYLCNVNHTSRATGTFEEDRDDHPTYWTLLATGWTARGEWQNSTSYNVGDVVYDGSDYLYVVCTTEHASPASGTLRDDIANWEIIFDGLAAVTAAVAAQVAAEAAQTASEVAQAAAETAETNAETAETNAETAETNAETAATTATTQAGIATTQASNAATSAANALTSENNAETAETGAVAAAAIALGLVNLVTGNVYGMQYSNSVVDPTNDITVSAGSCISDDATAPVLMAIPTGGIIKRLDAAWAVGTNQGGRDTGAISDNWWHIWVIKDITNNITDWLFSLSVSAPTMPANYTHKRLIGSVLRTAGALIAFTMIDDIVMYAAGVVNRASTSGTANLLVTLTTPLGRKLKPIITFSVGTNTNGAVTNEVGNGDSATADYVVQTVGSSVVGASADATVPHTFFHTNTSQQIRFSATIGAGTLSGNGIRTQGFVENRGRKIQ